MSTEDLSKRRVVGSLPGNPFRYFEEVFAFQFVGEFSGTIGVEDKIINRGNLISIHNVGKDSSVSPDPCHVSATRCVEHFIHLLNSIDHLNGHGIRNETLQVRDGPAVSINFLTGRKSRKDQHPDKNEQDSVKSNSSSHSICIIYCLSLLSIVLSLDL
jgi:hypothetical protein